jgi:uncharacterized membrane protein
MKKLLLICAVTISLFFNSGSILAQNDSGLNSPKKELLRAKVISILTDTEEVVQSQNAEDAYFRTQTLEIEITKGSIKGQRVIVGNDYSPLKEGQGIYLTYSITNGEEDFSYPQPTRIPYLVLLVSIFFLAIVFFAKKQGLKSFLTIAFSLLIVSFFVLPQIIGGRSPILIALGAGFVIITTTLYFVYGWNKKTHAAFFGTITSLLFVFVLSIVFSSLISLTGQANDQAIHIRFLWGNLIDLKGILLATIIIGTIGALNDVAVDQSSTVFALKEANNNLNTKQLYKRSIVVGKDHLLATINTLVLAYIGISLPLLLVVFGSNDLPIVYILNNEIFAEEITRTLLASIGLIAVTPLTTLFSVLLANRTKSKIRR